jgi:hypothetical protein
MSSDSDADSQDWSDWSDGEEENDACKALLTASVLDSPAACLEEAAQAGLDIRSLAARVRRWGSIQPRVSRPPRRSPARRPPPPPPRPCHHVQLALGDYDIIKLINYVRSEVGAGRDPRPAVNAATAGAPAPWADDAYLQPALLDDPLITYVLGMGEDDDATG